MKLHDDGSPVKATQDKKAPPQWVGTVAFRNGKRWMPSITVKAEARRARAAVNKALQQAEWRLPRGFRAYEVVIKISKVVVARGGKEAGS